MSRKSPSGFVTGLIVEIAIIAAVVSLLPRVPLGRAAPVAHEQVADERPSLVPRPEPLPPPDGDWRTAVSRPVDPASALPLDLPPADPAYVEKRLDTAGQHLLEGVSKYLSQQAKEVLQPPQPNTESGLAPPLPQELSRPRRGLPPNSFRY